MSFPRNEAAIVGIAETSLGTVNHSPIQMCVDLALEAAEDAGIKISDIDGLITTGVLAAEDGRDVQRYHVRIAEQLGLGELRLTGISKLGGGAIGETLRQAAFYLQAGILQYLLIVGADSHRTRLGARQSAGEFMSFHDNELESPYGHTAPSHWAINAQRYAHRFGYDAEWLENALAHIAVSAREWAVMNPNSRYYGQKSITLDEVRASKMVSSPLRVMHCSRSIDGGGAFIVTSRRNAEAQAKHKPVYVAGVGSRYYYYYMPAFEDMTDTVYEIQTKSCMETYEAAGMKPEDLDLAYPYDGFANMPLMFLEAMQLAPRGEAANLYLSGATSPGGKLPCNTHGGALNHGLPASPAQFFFVNEAVQQLRGEAGARQVPNARTTMVQAVSGVGGINASFILSNTR